MLGHPPLDASQASARTLLESSIIVLIITQSHHIINLSQPILPFIPRISPGFRPIRAHPTPTNFRATKLTPRACNLQLTSYRLGSKLQALYHLPRCPAFEASTKSPIYKMSEPTEISEIPLPNDTRARLRAHFSVYAHDPSVSIPVSPR